MAYHRLMFKCLACGFHFVGLTDHVDKWEKRIAGRGKQAFCPECGEESTILLGVERKEGFIFEECSARAGI